MKRNNILACLLFVLTALFPLFYLVRRVFLPDYTVLFDGWRIAAAGLHIILLGVCITMLFFKDKSVGRLAKVLLILSMMLLPVGRLLVAVSTEMKVTTSESLLYLAGVAGLVATAWVYVKATHLMITMITVFALVMGFSLSYSSFNFIFAFEKLGDLADIPAPDGIHHIRVIEYADDDNIDLHHKIVYSYDGTQSFSVGAVEFLKDFCTISDFYESEFDENTDISFEDRVTVTLIDKTYTYAGEQVTEPPLPPL